MLSIHWFAGIAVASTLSLMPDVAAAKPKPAPVAEPEVLVPLDPNQGQLPESITTDEDGNIYLSIGNTIGIIDPDGNYSTFATLPIPTGGFVTGLKFGDDGYLYAGTGAFSTDPSGAFVYRVSPDGEVIEQCAALPANGFPNDLAFDNKGNLYVTDPFLGQIYKIDGCGGDVSVFLDDPLLDPNTGDPFLGISPFGVDGIAFDKNYKNLYVGNLDYGRIVKIELEKNGTAGDVDVFYENVDLIGGVDGIAFDKQGTLYLAVHGQERIVAIDKKGKATIVAEGGELNQPSSLVFGATKNDKNTLYISNFSILSATGFRPGPPTPGLLTLDVKHGGQSLP
ncbi:MAG TPA: SMP-30/gluconolactonase/LRE family protein [Nannocystis sp.]|jgi:sugar lactone lactonase YvrE